MIQEQQVSHNRLISLMLMKDDDDDDDEDLFPSVKVYGKRMRNTDEQLLNNPRS